MHKLSLLLALAALCLLAVACSDNDPVKPEEFAVTVQVSDAVGDPVEGLQVALANDHQFFPWAFRAAKAAVKIPFRNDFAVDIRLTIEDIEGKTIRVVVEGNMPPNPQYHFLWDGKDDKGVHQPSGRYTAHLVATNPETGLWVFEDRADMLLSAPDYLFNGYTDPAGKLVLKDRKLFPHLYDRPDMMGHNENGEAIGIIDLTSLMLVVLTDTASGRYIFLREEILAGSVLDLTWDPKKSEVDRAERIVPELVPEKIEDPPYFELGPVFPNPFN